ncbi:MAG TPA: hypothetical protein VLZ54_11880 [Arenibacter sp.]|nr:hypothetical protein [Arenibacter sp.]
MFTKLMGINVDPIHWALLGCLILSFFLGVSYWKQSNDLRVCVAEHDSYVSNSKAEALASELDIARLTLANSTLTKNLEDQALENQNSINLAYADYNKRLLDYKRSAGKSGEAGLSEAASKLTCADDGTRLAEGLAKLETGVLERLAKSRDEAIKRTILCKEYLDSQEKLYEAFR